MNDKKRRVQTPKGLRDVYEDELLQMETLREILFKNARHNGYVRVETPSIESAEVFQRTSVFNPDKCYTFSDKAGRELVLRPDLNAPLARVVANHQPPLSMPTRLCFEGRVFRYRHNIKRSYRLFCVETFGMTEPHADADTLRFLMGVTAKMGFPGAAVDFGDVRLYQSLLIDAAKLDETAAAQLLHKIRFGQSPNDEKALLERYSVPRNVAETVQAWLHAGCLHEENRQLLMRAEVIHPEIHGAVERVAAFEEAMRRFGINSFRLSLSNLHGMGFYSGLTFRVTPTGCPKPLADGGRFDHMVAALGGKDTPATGIAFGMERLLRFMKAANLSLPVASPTRALLVCSDSSLTDRVRLLLPGLRERLPVIEGLGLSTARKQVFSYAHSKGLTHVAFVRPVPDTEQTWILDIGSVATSSRRTVHTTPDTFHTDVLTAIIDV